MTHPPPRPGTDRDHTERLYIYSFGSTQSVAHIHWHIAPLPPAVPFEQQKFAAADTPKNLKIPEWQLQTLTGKISASDDHAPRNRLMDVFLQTDRLRLRRFTTADVDNLVALDGDPEVMRF